MKSQIHPTAIVSKDARIADGVYIGPYTVIGEGVSIGEGTFIGPHCFIEHSIIGKGNKIFAYASIGLPPQDYKYNNEKTQLEIGDNNIIREFVSIHRGTLTANGVTKVGSKCFLMANSHIGHDCIVGNGVILVNSAALAGHVEVQDNAIISGLCGVHQFARIGRFVMLGGGAMVSQDIIPFVIAQGDRAKPVALNIVGLKRAGFSSEQIKNIKYAFKTLFFRGLKLSKAIDILEKENVSDEVNYIVEFCKTSKRGIARPRSFLSDE
ncbi:MAG: acyl-ACP--UDP-N-acetylglucosamine O-acyltransferase [Elusimicrobiales bacterium]